MRRIKSVLGWPDPRQVAASTLVVLLTLLYAGLYVAPLFGSHSPRADDFQDYLFAARQLTTGGDPYANFVHNHVPWDWSLSSGYLYPPVFAAALVPLTWVPNDMAVRVWLLAMQLAVMASLVIIYRTIGRPNRPELIALGAVLLTFFPLINSAATGAMNAVLLLLVTGAWACWMRRRDVASGVLVGVAAVFKLFPLALVPYLAWRRHWRLLLALSLTGAVGLAIGFVTTSPAHNIYYFREMLPHLAAGTGYRENQSLAGFTARLCNPSSADAGGSAGWCGRILDWPLVLALLGLLLSAVVRPTRSGLEFALAVAALPLISSVTWSFHLVLLILPIALLIRQVFAGEVSPSTRRWLMAAWVCFSIGPGIHYVLIVHPLPSSIGILGMVEAGLTRLAVESYLLGTLVIVGVLWIALRKEARHLTAAIPAAAAA